jgi:beta-lactamase class A
MRNRGPFSALRIISFGFLLVAVILTTIQLAQFSRIRANLPAGLSIAGIPVGGLTRQEAAQRLLEVYSTPVELDYNGSRFELNPAVVDFQLDVESMLAAADVARTQRLFWQDFWDFLWGRTSSPQPVPLSATFSEKRLRDYLADIAKRYDQPSEPPAPVPGSIDFSSGKPGVQLNTDGSVLLIENALQSLSQRQVDLPIERTQPSRPDFRNLEVLLKQTLDTSGFDGLAGVYILDLQTGQEIHFARRNGEDISVNPDIAFTASSIIKIPIMVSAFHRMGDNPDSETLKLMSDMIDKSGNEAADWLMERVIDQNLAPLTVSDDMKKLGLENTFLAGKFTFGSPLLQRFDTPANTRTDINTDPDPYSQTTPSDIGMLLEDIYQCAQTGGGALPAVFPGEITQTKCQTMNTYLINNRLPVLITAGLPEGTQVAHKHGWVSTNGIINTIGDAGIVYSLGGNYVVVIFLHNPDQLVWDPASELVAILSRAIYNYYNPPNLAVN